MFIFRYKHNKITENSHTIGALPEKPYSSLTGCPGKKINFPQIILSYNKGTKKKQHHCAGAIGHVQYHHFIYDNHNSHNTIARWPFIFLFRKQFNSKKSRIMWLHGSERIFATCLAALNCNSRNELHWEVLDIVRVRTVVTAESRQIVLEWFNMRHNYAVYFDHPQLQRRWQDP